jgi:hypothetical protein
MSSIRTKDRIRQLYGFLKEANQLRYPPVRQLKDQPEVIRLADMPAHPAMQPYRPVPGAENQQVSDILMRIGRPTTTRCPAPPESVATWLVPGWDDPINVASYAEGRNQVSDGGKTVTVRFDVQAAIRTADRRQTRFDNLAAGQVGRCRAAAAVRSRAEDERPSRPRAIRPGALFNP